MITDPDRAYVAALLDAFGRLTSRALSTGVELPEVSIQGRVAALDWLAEVTGTKVVEIPKGYNKHQCAEHCTERHTRVDSMTRRWVVTGARATIVLHNVEPFLRVHGALARNLVWVGQRVGYKDAVARDMAGRGWTVPELGMERALSVVPGRMLA